MTVSDELQFIVQQLTPQFGHVSLRGQGRASFVFAQHQGRAVEISENENNWWLQFWEVAADPDAPAVKELTLPTSLEAVKEASDWLACRHRQAALPGRDLDIPRARS